MQELTPRQAEILDWLKNELARQGYWPSMREIGEQFAISSTNGVLSHIRALESKGHIRRPRNAHGRVIARGYQIVEPVTDH